jgi:hypothetical protein
METLGSHRPEITLTISMNANIWLILLLALVAGIVAASKVVASITILEFEQALKFVRGRYRGLVGPGLYWYSKRTTSFRKVDSRPTSRPDGMRPRPSCSPGLNPRPS